MLPSARRRRDPRELRALREPPGQGIILVHFLAHPEMCLVTEAIACGYFSA